MLSRRFWFLRSAERVVSDRRSISGNATISCVSAKSQHPIGSGNGSIDQRVTYSTNDSCSSRDKLSTGSGGNGLRAQCPHGAKRRPQHG